MKTFDESGFPLGEYVMTSVGIEAFMDYHDWAYDAFSVNEEGLLVYDGRRIAYA